MAHIRVRKFLGSDAGSTSVEFAIISVPFLGLLFAIFQTSLAFFMQQGLEAAVSSAARQVLIGQVQSNANISTWQSFRDQLICPQSPAVSLLPSFMNCSTLVVDIRKAASFTGMNASNVSDNFLFNGQTPQFNPGCQGDIVVVRAAYPMPVYLPLITGSGSSVSQNTSGLTMYNGSLVQMLTAAAVFRSEPFGAQGNCP